MLARLGKLRTSPRIFDDDLADVPAKAQMKLAALMLIAPSLCPFASDGLLAECLQREKKNTAYLGLTKSAQLSGFEYKKGERVVCDAIV